MQYLTLKAAPPTKELIEVFKRDFSKEYAYKLFGLGKNKSIIVRKSPFVGVQVSKEGDNISIQRVLPSVKTTTLGFFDFVFLDGALDFFFGWHYAPKSKKVEKEIAGFIKDKYK